MNLLVILIILIYSAFTSFVFVYVSIPMGLGLMFTGFALITAIKAYRIPRYVRSGMYIDQTGQVRPCGGYWVNGLTGKRIKR